MTDLLIASLLTFTAGALSVFVVFLIIELREWFARRRYNKSTLEQLHVIRRRQRQILDQWVNRREG